MNARTTSAAGLLALLLGALGCADTGTRPAPAPGGPVVPPSRDPEYPDAWLAPSEAEEAEEAEDR